MDYWTLVQVFDVTGVGPKAENGNSTQIHAVAWGN